MDIISIIFLALFCGAFVGIFIFIVVKVHQTRRKCFQELTGEAGIYTGSAGEPQWNGHLPEKVDDYSEPRYVYENSEESTEYRPENGRIIGYRISPYLVIHSRIQENVNPPSLAQYVKRLGGKLLEAQDAYTLLSNWEKISKLRAAAKDLPMNCEWFWGTSNGLPVAYSTKDSNNLLYKDVSDSAHFCCSLILKR